MSLMLDEIYEEPSILEQYRTRDFIVKESVLNILNESGVIYSLGSGSSYNAAVYLSILLNRNGLNSIPIFASEARLMIKGRGVNETAVIFSQSGNSVDAIRAAEYIRSLKSRVVAITNTPDSKLELASDVTILTNVGEEKSIPATKSHLAQLLTSLFISYHSQRDKLTSSLIKAEKGVDSIIERPDFVIEVVSNQYSNSIFLGSGLLYPIALESSLKLTETSGSLSVAYPTREFLHGPKQMLGKNCAVFMLNSDREVEKSIREYSGQVVDVTEFLEKKYLLDMHDEVSSSIIMLVFFQLLSYFNATRLGYNPDKPSRLSKVVY